MLKQARSIFSSLFAVVLALAALTLPSPSRSQKDPQANRTAGARNAVLVPAIDSGPVARRSGGAQQGSVATTRNTALIAATEEVLKETSEVRRLSILRPVRSSAQSRAEIERMIIRSLDEETTPAQLHAIEATLKKLGMAPGDFQYRALMIGLLREQVAGYYDPKTGEFHLADWIDLDGQKPIMAHELTHALQDQHFNLRRFEHWPKGDSDAELAAHALIEGDATLAMALYVANNPLRALALLKSLGGASVSSVELDKAPRAVRESLVFPYQEGLNWTRAIYRRGGWQEVSQAFASLPQSTEQILHPEKYFAHEAPVKVTLPDLTELLNGGGRGSEVRGQGSEAGRSTGSASGGTGVPPVIGYVFTGSADVPSAFRGIDSQSVIPGANLPPVIGYVFTGSADVPSAFPRYTSRITHHSSLPSLAPDTRSPAPATWRRLDSDVQGEWGFYLILDQFLKSPAESRRATAGWGGDRYAVYESLKGEVLIASLSVWDTENDAREFFDAYVKRTGLRYPTATSVSTPAQSGARKSWQTPEGIVIIELSGSRVLILEGVREEVNTKGLLKALFQ